jgi:hypothetical protein
MSCVPILRTTTSQCLALSEERVSQGHFYLRSTFEDELYGEMPLAAIFEHHEMQHATTNFSVHH